MHAQQKDGEQTSLPPRSRLYPFKPIGVGTSQVESLTSYVARLAGAYHVTPKEFVVEVILPAQGRTVTSTRYDPYLSNFWQSSSSSLNGITSVAAEWVETLQTMTSCDILRYTTMLTWREVFAVNRLLRPSKAWCPQCYEERRQSAKVVYEPLLWALNGIEICLQHQQQLVSNCPHCQKTQPFLAQGSRPGYCSRCAGWLGSATSEDRESVSLGTSEEGRQKQWIAEAVGKLLEAAPKLPISPPKSQIATMMQYCVEHYARGNARGFGRLLGIAEYQPWQYIQQGKVPFFNTLLRICYVLAIRPLEFLTASTLTAPNPLQLLMGQMPKIYCSRGIPVTREDSEIIRQALETILAQDFQPPLQPQFVAQQLGCSVSTMRKHCPEQYQALSLRFRPVFATSTSRERLQEALEKALEGDEIKSLDTIAQEERCNPSVLRKYFPDLYQAAVTRVRNRIDHERIQRRFQEVLEGDAPVPSVSEFARQVGYHHTMIRLAYPDLCHELQTRRYTERKQQYENMVPPLCARVRKATITLHSEGTYPSAKKVADLLGVDQNIIRGRKVLETWQAMLGELGYREQQLG